jgi:anaerobic selenocysteine-containing dehydrogenase
MADAEWTATACILCYINCGIEVDTRGGNIVRVRGDRANPRSRGYACQKAHRLPYYGGHRDRLTHPLRRRPDGSFESITWETATSEIARRLVGLRERFGGTAFAFYGGGGQGNHLGGAYGVSLMRAMGSDTYFNALSQEKTGDFWVNGHLFGGQMVHTAEDIEHSDLLVVLGCNPWMAHGFTRARDVVNAIKRDPARRLLVIDPRRTEVAAVSDLHLQLRPGTDAYLLSAILAAILRRGGEAREFLAARTVGFEDVREALLEVPVTRFRSHAGISEDEFERAVEMILGARAMCVRVELGIQQARNSTLNSYLEKLLFLLTGHFGRRGTNNLHSWLQPLWGNSRGRRLPVTGQEQIAGLYPPNRLPAEVLTDHPDRIRAIWVDSANPANTAADTTAVERALRATELTVVVDVAMTETARLADYVLPASGQYEKWEYTLFNFEFPVNYFHARAPVLDPLPGTLPEPEIYTRLLQAMGDLPSADELEPLQRMAATDRPRLLREIQGVMAKRPALAAIAPVLLYQTLGAALADRAPLAPLWLSCHRTATDHASAVGRALGVELAGFELGEALFERVASARSGLAFTTHEPDEVWSLVKHRDGKVHLAVPRLLDWLRALDPEGDGVDPAHPYVLVGGQRRSFNANQIMRDPRWRKGDQEGTLAVHPADLASLGVEAGGFVAIETKTGRLVARIAADDSLRPGVVALAHGFGQAYPDENGERVVIGPRTNLITSSEDCDPIAATPYHKNVAVRLSALTPEDTMAAKAHAERVLALARE